jgi:hypothetical protein
LPEREFNRAVLLNSASAQASQDRAGHPTVTVRATFSAGGYSSTEQLHLSYGAALLLRDHLNAILP